MNKKDTFEFEQLMYKNLNSMFKSYINEFKTHYDDLDNYMILTEELYDFLDKNELYYYEDLLQIKEKSLGEFIYITRYGDPIKDWDYLLKTIKNQKLNESNNGIVIHNLCGLNECMNDVMEDVIKGESIYNTNIDRFVIIKSMLDFLNKKEE